MGTVRLRIAIMAVLLSCAVAAPSAGQMTRTPPPDKVPDDFPKDCPIISKAVIRDYLPAVKNRVKIGNILVLETPMTQEEIIAFYRKELPAAGYTVLKHPKNENDLLEASKGKVRLVLGVVAAHQGANPSTTYRIAAVNGKY
jgi:hypothetical protein